jgi:hypothetical protein
MAKRAKKRSKKKTSKKKSAGKQRKSSRKGKSAPKKKSSRKSVKREPARKAPAKRPPAEDTPPAGSDPAWPVLFATLFAFVAGLAAAWIFGEFSTAANAATFVSTLEPGHGCAAHPVQAATNWFALAPDLVALMR